MSEPNACLVDGPPETEYSICSQDQPSSRPDEIPVPVEVTISWTNQVIQARHKVEADSSCDIQLRVTSAPDMDFELSLIDKDVGAEATGPNPGDDILCVFKGKILGQQVQPSSFVASKAPKTPDKGWFGPPMIRVSLNSALSNNVVMWDYLEESDQTWELQAVLKGNVSGTLVSEILRSDATSIVKRFLEIIPIPGGNLREDVARLWISASRAVETAGGTIAPPYGDTFRGAPSSNPGASRVSLHNTGRAVDLNQGLWGVRYFPVDDGEFWIVYCKCAKQDGSQGMLIDSNTQNYWHAASQMPIPKGYYLNLTEMMRAQGFTRIKRWQNWTSAPFDKAEWWHFHYATGLKSTFADEMAVLGLGTQDLLNKGWTIAELSKPPG